MEDISNNNINLEIVEKEVEEKPKENPNYDVVRYTDKIVLIGEREKQQEGEEDQER